LIEEIRACFGGLPQSLVEELFDALPAFGIHEETVDAVYTIQRKFVRRDRGGNLDLIVLRFLYME
jgi:hypothetical protein